MFSSDVPIDHCTHVPVPVAQSSAESEYNASFTAVMALAHLIILNNDLINKDIDVVPDQAPLIILYRKSAVCMANNGKYNKHTRHIGGKMQFLRNGEE